MTQNSYSSLWNALIAAKNGADSFLTSADARVSSAHLASGTIFAGRAGELRGQSVVLLTSDQLSTALALLELDGIASRLAIYPNDSSLDHLPAVLEATGAEVVLTDRLRLPGLPTHIRSIRPQAHTILACGYDRATPLATEWITLTSGTMGPPKLVVHSLASLSGAILAGQRQLQPVVWGTLYDIRRFGGLQVFFRAFLSGSSLVLSSPDESIASYLDRAGALGITHISGTPSQWRRALMSGTADAINPEYVRLSGEIADQGILNQLRTAYPDARISHAFGSSEAGTVFEVKDGIAGFPADLSVHGPGVEMKVEDDTLRVRSPWTAARYQGNEAPVLKDADGFVDTGDTVDLRDGRYYFAGRRDGRINVGGLKVHPEEVEAVINLHPGVRMSRVGAKRSPVTGSVVVAEIVPADPALLEPGLQQGLQAEILHFCHKSLAAHKVPAVLRFVSTLGLADSGKMNRRIN